MEIQQLEIDFDKRILRINGEDMSDKISELHLDFENGEWSLTVMQTLMYTISNQRVKE